MSGIGKADHLGHSETLRVAVSRLKRHRWTESDLARLEERRALRNRESVIPDFEGEAFIRITGEPQAKPRQTQSDKWNKRPAVVKYRAWSDHAKATLLQAIGKSAIIAGQIHIVAYFRIPKSCKNPEEIGGQPHDLKPDCDNLTKACKDVLCIKDERVHSESCNKFWDDGAGARVEIRLVAWQPSKKA
jgi:Holliday junction resolvase RusA-like endonuclease